MYTQDILETVQELNKIDELRTQLVLRAERKCRKLKTGEVPFSPDNVQHHGKEIRLWSMIIQKKQVDALARN